MKSKKGYMAYKVNDCGGCWIIYILRFGGERLLDLKGININMEKYGILMGDRMTRCMMAVRGLYAYEPYQNIMYNSTQYKIFFQIRISTQILSAIT